MINLQALLCMDSCSLNISLGFLEHYATVASVTYANCVNSRTVVSALSASRAEILNFMKCADILSFASEGDGIEIDPQQDISNRVQCIQENLVKLASLLRLHGQYEHAKKVLLYIVSLSSGTCSDHIAAFSYLELCLTNEGAGNYEEMFQAAKHTAILFQTIYDSCHPQVLLCNSLAAYAELHMSEFTAAHAHEEVRSCCAQLQQSWQEHKPYASVSYMRVLLHHVQAQLAVGAESEEILRDAQCAFDLHSSELGISHPDTMWAKVVLGLSLQINGEIQSARSHFEDALLSLSVHLGHEHPLTAAVHSCIGRLEYMAAISTAKQMESIAAVLMTFEDLERMHLNIGSSHAMPASGDGSTIVQEMDHHKGSGVRSLLGSSTVDTSSFARHVDEHSCHNIEYSNCCEAKVSTAAASSISHLSKNGSKDSPLCSAAPDVKIDEKPSEMTVDHSHSGQAVQHMVSALVILTRHVSTSTQDIEALVTCLLDLWSYVAPLEEDVKNLLNILSSSSLTSVTSQLLTWQLRLSSLLLYHGMLDLAYNLVSNVVDSDGIATPHEVIESLQLRGHVRFCQQQFQVAIQCYQDAASRVRSIPGLGRSELVMITSCLSYHEAMALYASGFPSEAQSMAEEQRSILWKSGLMSGIPTTPLKDLGEGFNKGREGSTLLPEKLPISRSSTASNLGGLEGSSWPLPLPSASHVAAGLCELLAEIRTESGDMRGAYAYLCASLVKLRRDGRLEDAASARVMRRMTRLRRLMKGG